MDASVGGAHPGKPPRILAENITGEPLSDCDQLQRKRPTAMLLSCSMILLLLLQILVVLLLLLLP
jgi:hypothetical protein